MTNRPNLTKEEKEHYNKVAMDMIYKTHLDRISENIEDELDKAYELFKQEAISREDYINFLFKQVKGFNTELNAHRRILKKENNS